MAAFLVSIQPFYPTKSPFPLGKCLFPKLCGLGGGYYLPPTREAEGSEATLMNPGSEPLSPRDQSTLSSMSWIREWHTDERGKEQ